MSFVLSPVGIVLGLGVIAFALYRLQRLRVRHREVAVVTTLFWKQAVEETRARELTRRFRHWPAYLLFCAIGALLWLGYAQPRSSGGGEGRYVLLLDGSAGMAWQDRFEEAKAELLADIGSFPADRTQVLFCGGTVRTLLAPGENPLVLAKRLEGVMPEAAPASLRRALLRLLNSAEEDDLPAEGTPAVQAVIYGDGPLTEEAWVRYVAIERRSFAPDRTGNRGIAALGIAEAASGRWDAVDIYVEVRGGEHVPAALAIDGLDLPEPTEGEGSRLIWRDIPARGGLLEARLPSDGLTLDDTASVRMPTRAAIRVSLSERLPALRPLLESDAGVELTDIDPRVEISTLLGFGPPGSTPVLSFGNVDPSEPAIRVFVPTSDAEATLADLQQKLALAEIDGSALAEALGAPVRVVVEDSPTRAILVSDALLRPDAGFVTSRAFPLFVAGAIRLLAGIEPLRPFVAAGEPVAHTPRPFVHEGHTLDPLGTDFVPPVVGSYGSETSAPLQASLLAGPLTGSASALDGETQAGRSGGFDAALLIILLAFALLLVEWTLFRTGRVP